MIWYFIIFVIAYFFGRVIGALKNHADYIPDVLLEWDADLLAWRPVSDGENLQEEKRYLAAFEFEPIFKKVS